MKSLFGFPFFQTETMPSSKILMILGMHRSGTSCLAGMLEQSGLYLGKVSQSNDFNLKGNRENRNVGSLNERLLRLNGGSWFSPVEIRKKEKNTEKRVLQYMARLGRGKEFIGIKDPRMIFCLDVWRLPAMFFIGTFRHPQSVAASLYRRERNHPAVRHLTTENWQDVWLKYNEKLLSIYERQPFTVVNFDWPKERYVRAVSAFARTLGLGVQRADFFEPSLRNDASGAGFASERHRKMHERLCAISNEEEKKLLERARALSIGDAE